MDSTKEYKFVGLHADQLDGGRSLNPGDTVGLTDDDMREPEAERLAADRLLIGMDDAASHQVSLAAKRMERRSTKTEDEPPTQEEIAERASGNPPPPPPPPVESGEGGNQ